MALPHYKSYTNDKDSNPYEPIWSYCGNCLSDNLKKDLDNCYFVLDMEGRCECLDCGWKGTKFECNNMHKWERDKKYKELNSRRIKIEKIKSKVK